jgi:C1A family cysteine protease
MSNPKITGININNSTITIDYKTDHKPPAPTPSAPTPPSPTPPAPGSVCKQSFTENDTVVTQLESSLLIVNEELAKEWIKVFNNWFFNWFININPFTKKKNFKLNDISDPNILFSGKEHLIDNSFNTTLNWASQCNRLNQSVLGPIKNQGGCGSCWAFGTACVLETYITMNSIENKYSNNYVSISEQHIVTKSQSDQGCQGGLFNYAIRDIEQTGIITTDSCEYKANSTQCPANLDFIYPENGTPITSWVIGFSNILNLTNDHIKKLLQIYGPLVTGIHADLLGSSHPAHHVHKKEDFDLKNGDKNVDHQVVLIGYGRSETKPYWILRNSWGTWWGLDGYWATEMSDTPTMFYELGAITDMKYDINKVTGNTTSVDW